MILCTAVWLKFGQPEGSTGLSDSTDQPIAPSDVFPHPCVKLSTVRNEPVDDRVILSTMRDGFGSPINPRLLWGTLIALLALAGCTARHAPTTRPSEGPSATSIPTSAMLPTTPAARELVEVAVDELAIGSAPEGIAEPDVRVQPATVRDGTRLWVLDETDGWMLVVALAEGLEETTPIGWVASEVGGERTVRPVGLACPASPVTVEQLLALGSFGGLACFEDRSIDVLGYVPAGCGIGGSPRVGSPEWLNGTWSSYVIGADAPMPPEVEVGVVIGARAAPESTLPSPCGAPGWYRFSGHFDDPASATCRTESVDGLVAIVVEPHVSELLCRDNLVLDSAVRLAGRP